MKRRITVKGLWKVLKDSFSGFSNDKITKLSASLAYYTLFSFGPLLIVIIYFCSVFFGRDAVEGTIYNQLASFVGADAALQLQHIIQNAAISGKGSLAATIGIVTLVIGATSVFAEIQDSINTIWGLKAKPKLGIMKLLLTRLVSFGMIISLGFLLLVSLSVTALIELLNQQLKAHFPNIAVVVLYIINLVVSFIVTTLLFGVIFKVLPDAKIKWKDVFAGAIATGILFMIGKFLISIYISKSNVGTTYGTAGSLVVLILWIYYSAIILYFGAEFTKAYAVNYGGKILPNDYAVTMQTVEVETGKKTVQQNEKEEKHIEAKVQRATNANENAGNNRAS